MSNATTARKFSPAQNAYMTAKALHETARAVADAEIKATTAEPADYCANQAAALAYEEAVVAIEAAHDVDTLRRVLRLAEDTLIDWAMDAVSVVPRFAEVKASIPAMRASYKLRGKLIDTCMRLAAVSA
jgi:hypothetical protein